MYEQRRADVAVFIDFENVYVSVRDKLNANPNFEAIMDRCGDLGRVVISRAYADWYRYPRVTSALYANAIEPIYVATYYYDKDMGRTGRAIKNSVDMNLCIDAMKTLFTNPNISRFVLVTGDRDFIPLVNSIRQQGKEVYIIGIGGAASTHLAQSADEFVFYEQLVGKQSGGSAAATAIANRASELNRGLDPATYETPIREREREREPVVPAVVAVPVPPVSAPTTPPPSEPDIYTILVDAIHLVRKRGYVSTLGSIKLVMKELLGGDFKESRYRDLNGRPFTKFKDFVLDAEKRGKVQIFTNGTVNEVFLPGEDPYKLSQFAAALTEEVAPVEPVFDVAVTTNGRKETVSPRDDANGEFGAPNRRRRRRSRRSQATGATVNESPDLSFDEPELDEPDYTPPTFGDDDLRLLDQLEAPAELAALREEQLPDELSAAAIPEDLIADATALEATTAGLIDLPPLELDDPITSDDLAWDAAVIALAAVDTAPADAVWDAAVIEPPPPAESVWDEVASVLAAEHGSAFATTFTQADEVALVATETAPTQAEGFVSVEAEAPTSVEASAPLEGVAQVGEAEDDAIDVIDPITFTDEEWAIFQSVMRGFAKPTSFQQIYETLRGKRKEHGLNRTNEQLRTLIKQAINQGMLERSGRGKRVYYALKVEAKAEPEAAPANEA